LRKYTPYIILAVLAGVIIYFIARQKMPKRFNDTITFRLKDKIPYGTYVAFQSLRYMFPEANIHINSHEPGYWDSLSTYDSGQALVIISPNFFADDTEMEKLIRFVKNGNDVFISARYVSAAADEALRCETSVYGISSAFRRSGIPDDDSLVVSLYKPPYPEYKVYSYPGYRYSAWAYNLDSLKVLKLGGNDLKHDNFLHFRAGKGNLFLHLAPMAFSNYFLLNKSNIEYYEQVFSVLSPNVKKIAWDEYYLKKRMMYADEKRPGWFNVLMEFPGLKSALLTAVFFLLLFALVEMRRKQRYIPVITSPRNDSLDFVKTIGRLYHDKADHKNLCQKLAAYFLDHVRTRYNLQTGKPGDEFIKNLHYKSGFPVRELEDIMSMIRYLEGPDTVSDKQLVSFYKRLERFYQNT
jgi:hypothetical protein